MNIKCLDLFDACLSLSSKMYGLQARWGPTASLHGKVSLLAVKSDLTGQMGAYGQLARKSVPVSSKK